MSPGKPILWPHTWYPTLRERKSTTHLELLQDGESGQKTMVLASFPLRSKGTRLFSMPGSLQHQETSPSSKKPPPVLLCPCGTRGHGSISCFCSYPCCLRCSLDNPCASHKWVMVASNMNHHTLSAIATLNLNVPSQNRAVSQRVAERK